MRGSRCRSVACFSTPAFNSKLRVRHEATCTALALVAACSATIQAAKIRRLFLAEAVNETHSAAIISLAGAAIVLGTNLVEAGMFVVELDQANRPALLEFHVRSRLQPSRCWPSPND